MAVEHLLGQSEELIFPPSHAEVEAMQVVDSYLKRSEADASAEDGLDVELIPRLLSLYDQFGIEPPRMGVVHRIVVGMPKT